MKHYFQNYSDSHLQMYPKLQTIQKQKQTKKFLKCHEIQMICFMCAVYIHFHHLMQWPVHLNSFFKLS